MNNIINNVLNSDCIASINVSFIELILSTFLGFASALLVETIIDRCKEKALRKQLIRDLYSELLALKENIKQLNADMVYIQPYSIPIWIGARECGTILCMDKKPYFVKILEVYSSIEEANLIEMKCFELYVSRTPTTDIEQIKSTLADNRIHVKKQIDIGLALLNEGE